MPDGLYFEVEERKLRPVAGERGVFEFVVHEWHYPRLTLPGKRLKRSDHLLRFRVNDKHVVEEFWYVHTTDMEREGGRSNGQFKPVDEPTAYRMDRWRKEELVDALHTAWCIYSIGYAGETRGWPTLWRERPNPLNIPMETELKQ